VSDDARTAQRLQALSLGTEHRRARGACRAYWTRVGRSRAASQLVALMAECPRWVLTWKVCDALGAVPYVGPTRVRRWMKWAQVSDAQVVGSLSDTQRSMLSQFLSEHAHTEEALAA
jgi:hypothetical protein